ncbi:MAG: hypothetical protein OSB70_03490 [Myxococcota bacterium]|nr:hypothetical protein [Myxococcota bacterium]
MARPSLPQSVLVYLALWSLLVSATAPAPARAAPTLDLIGTWFVLIHYQDPGSANPEAFRWSDKVWEFARKGTRLQWTEYPIVVFEDTQGRFEAIAGNPRSRVLAAWEPNTTQAQTISGGPRVNPRGTKTKTLRGSDARGWASSQRMPTTSASIMGYHEQLRIDDPSQRPVFERRDVVGNALTHIGEGLTRYQVTEVLKDGRVLSGRYERDGRLHGRFRMWRTPPPRSLVKKDKTPNQRAREASSPGEAALP